MDNIIDKITTINTPHIKSNTFDYFFNYSKNITDQNKENVKQFINDHYTHISQDAIDGIRFYYLKDIGNKNSQNITSQDKYNYVLACLYIYINNCGLDNVYINSKYKEKLYIVEKSRPHMLEGKIQFEDETIINCRIIQITDLPMQQLYSKMMNVLTETKCPLPYFKTNFTKENNLIVIEDCNSLNPSKDAFIEVFKDIINQLKCINKKYYLQYIKPQDIGKSNVGFKRYFIHNFISLIDKTHKIKIYNMYDGREIYSTITEKDQIRTVLNILSEIYTEEKDYRTAIKRRPFSDILFDIENYKDTKDNIHEYMLTKLMSKSY